MDPKPYIPRTLWQVSAAAPGLVPQLQTCLALIAPTMQNFLFKELGSISVTETAMELKQKPECSS